MPQSACSSRNSSWLLSICFLSLLLRPLYRTCRHEVSPAYTLLSTPTTQPVVRHCIEAQCHPDRRSMQHMALLSLTSGQRSLQHLNLLGWSG